MAAATWQGTGNEFARLQQAVARNCDCVDSEPGQVPVTCAAHLMLDDQATLDHLLWVFRTRRVFVSREFYALPIGPRRNRAAR